MTIDSPTNPIIKQIRSLAEPKGRRATGQFLVEGVRGVEDGLMSGAIPTVCLINEELLARTERGIELDTMLRNLSGTHHMTCYAVTERVLKAASQTEQPQGVVAAFPLPVWDYRAVMVAKPLLLICDSIRDPGNMGTLLRSAEAAGADAVWAAQGCVDFYNPKVVRSAMGAHFRLPIFGDLSWTEIGDRLPGMSVLPERVFCTEAASSRPYDQVDWTDGCALIVSSEAHGLSSQAQELCGRGNSVSIPMTGRAESLNAAVAASVILFEAARQRRIKTG